MTDIKQVIQELKPCPFCGTTKYEPNVVVAKTKFVGSGYMPEVFRVECVGCAASTFGLDREEAVAAWNTRSSVEGGTVDLTPRIEAAAEEIAAEISAHQWFDTALLDCHIAAIIKRHLEVK